MVNWGTLIAQAGAELEPLPDGDYDVVVTKAESKKSSNEKTMIVAEFRVLNGPCAGKYIWNNFVVTEDKPRALAFFFRHLAVLGADAAFFASNPTPEQVAAKIVGAQCTASVGHRTYQGVVRNQVGGIRSLIGGVSAPPAPGYAPSVPSTPATPAPAYPQAPPPPAYVPPAYTPPAYTPPAPPVVPEPEPEPSAPQAPPPPPPPPAPPAAPPVDSGTPTTQPPPLPF